MYPPVNAQQKFLIKEQNSLIIAKVSGKAVSFLPCQLFYYKQIPFKLSTISITLILISVFHPIEIFEVCKSNLKDKVRRSFFAACRYQDFSKIPPGITNKLFNSLFLPILLYGSEVWGIYDKDDFTLWEKGIIEKKRIFSFVSSHQE